MLTLAQSSDFKSIVLNNTPLIDVRAPIEFQKGAFVNAINLPLMNDEERHLVGIKYKKNGNAEAIKLGHKLVSGEIKSKRIEAWSDYITSNPDAMLYCFRGGQRSKISQEWIAQTEKEIVRLKGGYKAFRNYLMQEIEASVEYFKPFVIGGRTGCGKTIFLKNIQNSIDLEGLANHRGSSFGRRITPQPTQINFENNLAYDLIQKLAKGFEYLLFEDEGKFIGSVYIPKNFASYLAQAPRIILEASMSERIEITFQEYIITAQESYKKLFFDNFLDVWKNEIYDAMKRIEKRIGSQRYKKVCELFENAVQEQINSQSWELYKDWIAYLLEEYYDPMYDYQIQKHESKIIFRGTSQEIINHFENVLKRGTKS